MVLTVYSKPSCPACNATTRALDLKEVDYKLVDITLDQDAFTTAVNLRPDNPYSEAPIVHVTYPGTDRPDVSWSGFRPDTLLEAITPN